MKILMKMLTTGASHASSSFKQGQRKSTNCEVLEAAQSCTELANEVEMKLLRDHSDRALVNPPVNNENSSMFPFHIFDSLLLSLEITCGTVGDNSGHCLMSGIVVSWYLGDCVIIQLTLYLPYSGGQSFPL